MNFSSSRSFSDGAIFLLPPQDPLLGNPHEHTPLGRCLLRPVHCLSFAEYLILFQEPEATVMPDNRPQDVTSRLW